MDRNENVGTYGEGGKGNRQQRGNRKDRSGSVGIDLEGERKKTKKGK